jgi:VanZ family protein
MRTDRTDRSRAFTAPWCLFCALALVAQIFTLNALPFELPEPWDKAWHFLAYAGLTLLAWIAADGRRPVGVVCAVMLLAGLDELRQDWVPNRSAEASDLLAGLSAAVVTAAALTWFTKGKPACAESSRR